MISNLSYTGNEKLILILLYGNYHGGRFVYLFESYERLVLSSEVLQTAASVLVQLSSEPEHVHLFFDEVWHESKNISQEIVYMI